MRSHITLVLTPMKKAQTVLFSCAAIALLSLVAPRASAQGDSAEHTKKGIELAKEKKYDQAAEEFGAAMKADPNDPKHYLNRGRAYRAAGKFDLAEKDFSKLIEMEPKSSNGYSERAKPRYRKRNTTRRSPISRRRSRLTITISTATASVLSPTSRRTTSRRRSRITRKCSAINRTCRRPWSAVLIVTSA